MLQIRLKRDPSSEVGGGGKPLPTETVTVACPDHLVLADLPVAKGLGTATSAAVVKVVGRKSRRQLGERVHFCVRCDFPIAIYGRLSPCEHAFCLDCARSDSICYLCDERIQKIQTIKMMEGIFICAAPHCLKSFMKKGEFEAHIHDHHSDLLNPNAEKEEGNESESRSLKQPAASESNARAPPRQGLSPGPFHDREDRARNLQSREQTPMRPPLQQKPLAYTNNNPSESQTDSQRPPGFDRPGPHGLQQESSQFPEKSHGMPSDNPFHEYPPLNPIPQPPNFMMPLPSTPMLNPPPPFGFPPFQPEGAVQPFFPGPYDAARQDSAPEMNFAASYPSPWNGGSGGSHFENPGSVQGGGDNNYQNQGEYIRNHIPGPLPLNPLPLPPNMPGSGSGDVRDGKGILAPLPLPFPPPPLPQSQPPHMQQNKRGKFYSGDGQGLGWQHENRDSFGSNQD